MPGWLVSTHNIWNRETITYVCEGQRRRNEKKAVFKLLTGQARKISPPYQLILSCLSMLCTLVCAGQRCTLQRFSLQDTPLWLEVGFLLPPLPDLCCGLPSHIPSLRLFTSVPLIPLLTNANNPWKQPHNDGGKMSSELRLLHLVLEVN